MNQSAIFTSIYDSLYSILNHIGEESALFTVREGFESNDTGSPVTVFLAVSDLCQIAEDKNGEKIIVDEQQYPAPTMVALALSIHISGQQYGDILNAAGYIIRYFKDNNGFSVGECTWHGNSGDMVYLEPLVRHPHAGRQVLHNGCPFLILDYTVEAAINSEKGGTFKRVQKTDIRSKTVE